MKKVFALLLAVTLVFAAGCSNKTEQPAPTAAPTVPETTTPPETTAPETEPPMPKLEAGTIPFQSIYALRAGITRLMEIGMDQVAAHIRACMVRLEQGLTELGYRIALPYDPNFSCNSLMVCTEHNQEMTDFFLRNGVFFSCGKPGLVRMSVAPFTMEQDIVRLLEVAKLWKETHTNI